MVERKMKEAEVVDDLRRRLATIRERLREVVISEGEDAGSSSRLRFAIIILYEYFSPLGDALVAIAKLEKLGKVFTDTACIPWETDFSPDLRMFVERIWPVFIEAIQNELV